MSQHDENIREKTEHLTPNAPSGGYRSQEPLARHGHSRNPEANIQEKTEHLSPTAPSGGYSNDPLARDHYQRAGSYGDFESNNLTRTQTGMTLTPEMFERLYLNPKQDV